jgi:hypothetical protein
MAATNEGSGQFKGKIQRPLELGEHILYAYETDGQEATFTNTAAQSNNRGVAPNLSAMN